MRHSRMIRKKPALHLMRDGHWFSERIMRKQAVCTSGADRI